MSESTQKSPVVPIKSNTHNCATHALPIASPQSELIARIGINPPTHHRWRFGNGTIFAAVVAGRADSDSHSNLGIRRTALMLRRPAGCQRAQSHQPLRFPSVTDAARAGACLRGGAKEIASIVRPETARLAPMIVPSSDQVPLTTSGWGVGPPTIRLKPLTNPLAGPRDKNNGSKEAPRGNGLTA